MLGIRLATADAGIPVSHQLATVGAAPLKPTVGADLRVALAPRTPKAKSPKSKAFRTF